MKQFNFTLLLLSATFSLTLSAQGACQIDDSNSNLDFCTICSSGPNPAIVDGVFTGELWIMTDYTISESCLSGITFEGQFDLYMPLNAFLIFDIDPVRPSGTNTIVYYDNRGNKSTISAFGTEYDVKGHKGSSTFSDFATMMSQSSSGRTSPTIGGGSFSLPVDLVSWTASERAGKIVLEWTTASEADNAYFQIERSADGRNFTPLKQVSGHGTSQQTHHYQAIDPTPAAGVNYYRITQYDFDGTAHGYPVLVVESPSPVAIAAAHPNPVPGGGELVFSAPIGATSAELYRIDGARVAIAAVDGSGTGRMSIPGDLASGIYILRVGSRSERISVR